jgi:hypothetical protein
MKLAAFGLADKVEAISRAGIRLARKAAGDDVLVAADLGVIPAAKLADRLYVAIATVAEIDMLVSWNYRHLVNVRRREKVNAANLFAGYTKPLEIVTPPEVLEDEVQ